MKIALFFGSFNPIHVGHLIIANHIVEHTDVDSVWLVVSPQNPFKEKNSLLNEFDRLHLVELAIQDNDKLKACNEEFYLPRPSYTIDTLMYLQEKYPSYEFSLIMGSDNLLNLHKWKNYELILQRYPIYIYKRNVSEVNTISLNGNIQYLEVPLLDISSTYIRQCIQSKKSIKYLVTPTVEKYILDYNLFKNNSIK
ncbi:MAG: nicotinate (nicotinamide) nucleotide adenylyltransferase [Bacteroidota bacterium]